MPRLFTGLEIPATQRTLLSLLQHGEPSMRWVEPSDFHVTLRFIGDVSPRMADDVCEMLSRKEWTAPEIRLGELKAFGGGKPRSIYASVAHDDHLTALAAAQERLMRSLGLKPETRRFTPHVTIGRCKAMNAERVAHYLARHGGFTAPPFVPTRFVLYSARESVGGGPYHAEASWPLIAPLDATPSEAFEQEDRA